MSPNQYNSKTAKTAKQTNQNNRDEFSIVTSDTKDILAQPVSLSSFDSTETIQEVSSQRFEEDQKWHHSLVMQIPLIFDIRLKDSIMSVVKAVKLMSKCCGGTRIWFELGTYISREGRFALDLNIWVKSQMNEKKFSNSLSKVRDLACQIRDELRQEAVVLEIDGDMECH